MEFTGDYYRCHACGHYWDYNDDCCPECGSDEISDVPIKYEILRLEKSLKLLKSLRDKHE